MGLPTLSFKAGWVTDLSETLRYRIPSAPVLPSVLLILVVAGLVFLIMTLTIGGPWWFAVGYLLVTGWLAYNFLFRTAYQLEVEGGIIIWKSFGRTERVAVGEVRRLSTAYLGSIQVVECSDGRKLRVPVTQGYEPFIQAFRRLYPDLPVESVAYSRMVDRIRIGRPPRDR